MGRAGCDDQKVVTEFGAIFQYYDAPRHLDSLHIGHQHRGIFLLFENLPNRCSDGRRRKPRGRYLIKQRLEQVVIGAVDDGDPHRRTRELLCGEQAAKSASQDDYVLVHFSKHSSNNRLRPLQFDRRLRCRQRVP